VNSIVIWRPEALNARLLAASLRARSDWAKAAAVRCNSKRVAASIRVIGDRVAALDPLGSILEAGARPHTIEPKRKVMKLADGGFVSGPVQHPGSPAQPFMRPTLPLWAPLYRRAASGAFRGF
jgi:hypothetical protein